MAHPSPYNPGLVFLPSVEDLATWNRTLMTDQDRDSLLSTFTHLHNRFGRNFLNYFRGTMKIDLMASGNPHDDDDNYRSETTLDVQRERFRQLTLEMGTMARLAQCRLFLSYAGVEMNKKDVLAENYGACEQKKDWFKWSDEIEEKCRDLNRKYGGLYREALYNFLAPIHAVIMDDNNSLDNLRGNNYPVPPKTDSEAAINFDKMISTVEGYKNSMYCGFMYSILHNFLKNFWRMVDVSAPDSIRALCVYIDKEQKKEQKMEVESIPVNVSNKQLSSPTAGLPNVCNGFSNFSPYKKRLN
uniref:OGFr_N domain-containing protein n=1 Tax=Caenorhabditis tropicalis TaxID=1561998 RepID=A0A1I7TRW1_9PELO